MKLVRLGLVVALSLGAFSCSGVESTAVAPSPSTGVIATPAPAPAPASTPAPSPTPTTCTTPVAPTGFTVSVSGNSVTFSWSNVSGATDYTVEAGSSPGGAGTLSISTSQTSYTWNGAAAGTYYARVGARNACATGAASAEVVVAVASTSSPSPIPSPSPSRQRIGATCNDGWLSSATGSGACSSHEGVRCWRYSDGTCTNP